MYVFTPPSYTTQFTDLQITFQRSIIRPIHYQEP